MQVPDAQSGAQVPKEIFLLPSGNALNTSETGVVEPTCLVCEEVSLPPCDFQPSTLAVPLPLGFAGVPHSFSACLSLLLGFILWAVVHVSRVEGAMGLIFLLPFAIIYGFYICCVVGTMDATFRRKLSNLDLGDPLARVAALQKASGQFTLVANCTNEVRTGDREYRTETKYAEREPFPHVRSFEHTPQFCLPPSVGNGMMMLHISAQVNGADMVSQDQLDSARRMQRQRCKGRARSTSCWEEYSLMTDGADTATVVYARPRFADAILYCIGGHRPWWCSTRVYWIFTALMMHELYILMFNLKVRGAWICLDRTLAVSCKMIGKETGQASVRPIGCPAPLLTNYGIP